MTFSATYFLGTETHFRGATSVHPALYVEPDGRHRPGHITFQLGSELSIAEQLQVAERFAAATAAWRDELATRAEEERSAADELATARAEIARLKTVAGEDA